MFGDKPRAAGGDPSLVSAWAQEKEIDMRTRRLPLGALLVALMLGAVVAVGASAKNAPSAPAARAATGHRAAPATAREFASLFIALSNAHAEQHGKPARFTGADCVQGSAGHFMCSYAIVHPGRGRTCHLMQAEWTPNGPSSFEVTLAGRVPTCRTLREALRSLK